MPEATLRAFGDHGGIGPALDSDASAAEHILRDAEAAGVDLDSLTAELEHEGVRSFCDSYEQLTACIEAKLARPRTDRRTLTRHDTWSDANLRARTRGSLDLGSVPPAGPPPRH
jgi:hypothetical protein